MSSLLRRRLPATLLSGALALSVFAQPSNSTTTIRMPAYSVEIKAGEPPRLTIARDGQAVFEVPVVSGLASDSQQEQLSAVEFHGPPGRRWNLGTDRHRQKYALGPAAASSGAFFPTASSSGSSPPATASWGAAISFPTEHQTAGTTAPRAATPGTPPSTPIAISRPIPTMPTSLNSTSPCRRLWASATAARVVRTVDFRPERIIGIFAPPPLFLAFHLDKTWTGIGIGAKPGEYLFPALEYTGSRYAGASFYVDYLGYKAIDGDFASPVLSFTFAYDPLDALAAYTAWLDKSGFSTRPRPTMPTWHHLPVFCGWAEQTVDSVPSGGAPNKLATQANYEKWIAVLEQRGLPVGTVVIDDKWQQGYGSFEPDPQKWPDMKGFVAAQHAKGRHVLLWVPLAQPMACPNRSASWCRESAWGRTWVSRNTRPGLRPRIRHLVQDIGVDGFKEDWVDAPTVPGVPLSGGLAGIEFVRRFQWILYDETHKAKPDALVETQTVNPLFRESSDVTRLNDIWYATRNVPDMMRLRARIAHISGWPVLDTDNASSTTLKDWWDYMQAQPSIGIPALYFVSKTEATQETPSDAQWSALAGLWRSYIASLPGKN